MVEAPNFLSQGPKRQPDPERSVAADVLSGLGLLVAVGLVYVLGIAFLVLSSWNFASTMAGSDAAAAAAAARERAAHTHTAYWIAGFLIVTLAIGVLAVRREKPWTAGLHFCAAAFLAIQLAVVTHGSQTDHPTPAPPAPAVPVCHSGSICP